MNIVTQAILMAATIFIYGILVGSTLTGVIIRRQVKRGKLPAPLRGIIELDTTEKEVMTDCAAPGSVPGIELKAGKTATKFVKRRH